MIDNLEILSKWFVATGSIITILVKLIDTLSKERRKKSLVEDINLIRSILENDNIKTDNVNEELYNKKVEEFLILSDSKFKWFDTLYALFLFIGFGFLTIYLVNQKEDFDPWSLLTTFISIAGLGLLLDSDRKSKKAQKEILKIIIFKELVIGIIILFAGIGFITILLSKYSGYTNWYILPGVFIPLSLNIIRNNFKIKKTRKPNTI